MSIPLQLDRFEPNNHLGVTLAIAVALHALVIFGLNFDFSDDPERSLPTRTLDIILVHQKSESENKNADFYAQANLQGGGEHETAERPESPRATPSDIAIEDLNPEQQPQLLPTSPEQTQTQLQNNQNSDDAAYRSEQNPALVKKDQLTPTELILSGRALAMLNADEAPEVSGHGKRPRHTHINANTQAFKYASYMDAWRQKVERIGNLNYPESVRKRNLNGNLLLDVSLNPDGSLLSIELLRSSGSEILDDAAIQIVRLAAPYAPFPPDIRAETDVLHIIRTWQFSDSHRITTGRSRK